MQPQSEKLIRASRIIIAALIIYFISAYFSLKEISWIYITLFMVMSDQDTLGGLLNKSYMRILGTVAGAVSSLLIIWLFNNNWIIDLLALCIGITILSYVYLDTPKSYIAAIGGATLAICLINYGDTLTAGLRVLNILLGIIISVFAFYLYFPKRASTTLIKQFSIIINQLVYLTNSLHEDTLTNAEIQKIYADTEPLITGGFITINRLISETKIELPHNPEFTTLCSQILAQIKHIFRYYDSLNQAIISRQIILDDVTMQSLSHLGTLLNITSKLFIPSITHDSQEIHAIPTQITSTFEKMAQQKNNNFSITITQLIFTETRDLLNNAHKLVSYYNRY